LVGEHFPDGEDVWAIPKNMIGGFRIYMGERARVIIKNVLFEELALGGETVMAS
jgi:putative component of toxin-antitoxin plasmid stabilization module